MAGRWGKIKIRTIKRIIVAGTVRLLFLVTYRNTIIKNGRVASQPAKLNFRACDASACSLVPRLPTSSFVYPLISDKMAALLGTHWTLKINFERIDAFHGAIHDGPFS